MKTILALIAISFSANSIEIKPVKSIDIHNLSQSKKQIWVNGTSHSIESGSSLWVPCLPEENMEVQISDMIETLVCGESMELDQ